MGKSAKKNFTTKLPRTTCVSASAKKKGAQLNPPIRVRGSSFAVPSPHLFPTWAGQWAGARCGVACACVRLQRRTASEGPLGLYY